jgi:CheY-like chemotaxis protein
MHTVAMADSNTFLFPVLELLLEPLGFRLVGFPSGKEMLERYDPIEGCVLVDVYQHYFDGFEVLERFKKRWAVPVIMLSCWDAPKFRQRAGELGAFAYLLKPWKTPELIDLLTRACDYSDIPTIVERSPRERPYCG